ncbi:MAG: alpha/beta hydrolase [Bacteroidota bacterium]|nr:alpha/beta hydrolase [Bacteroidota bacterium]
MINHTLVFLSILCCASVAAKAQNLKPYKDLVFTDVTIDKDQTYDPAGPQDKMKVHRFDLYQPKGDRTTARPLMIWMHGGGFKFGSKDAQGIKFWCKNFAQRGYVCAGINYQLGKKTASFNFDQLQKSCFSAVQDAKMAVGYFRKHYREYGIDPNKIILAGNSAGGMIALQAAYVSDRDLAKMAGLHETGQAGLLKVAGVVNFWGGIFDINWLKNARVPIVSVLGNKDRVVPPTHKDGPLYGGIDIHAEADKLNIPNNLKIFDGYSHELQRHFNPVFPAGKETQERWQEASQFAAEFLYSTVLK